MDREAAKLKTHVVRMMIALAISSMLDIPAQEIVEGRIPVLVNSGASNIRMTSHKHCAWQSAMRLPVDNVHLRVCTVEKPCQAKGILIVGIHSKQLT